MCKFLCVDVCYSLGLFGVCCLMYCLLFGVVRCWLCVDCCVLLGACGPLFADCRCVRAVCC